MRRESAEKKIPVASIVDLHRVVWKEEILDIDAKNLLSKKGLEQVVDAVAVLKETEGGMSDYDLTLVKDVSKSLTVLDLTLES
jgi:N-acetyl-beta-hexosaminidase